MSSKYLFYFMYRVYDVYADDHDSYDYDYIRVNADNFLDATNKILDIACDRLNEEYSIFKNDTLSIKIDAYDEIDGWEYLYTVFYKEKR